MLHVCRDFEIYLMMISKFTDYLLNDLALAIAFMVRHMVGGIVFTSTFSGFSGVGFVLSFLFYF